MRAAVMREHALLVEDVAEPEPGPGEALVKTLACGICGSDLHALEHFDQFTGAGVHCLPAEIGRHAGEQDGRHGEEGKEGGRVGQGIADLLHPFQPPLEQVPEYELYLLHRTPRAG